MIMHCTECGSADWATTDTPCSISLSPDFDRLLCAECEQYLRTRGGLDDLEDIELDGIDYKDAPDFCDAYIVSASWKKTGKPLTEDEIDELEDCVIYAAVEQYLY